MPQTKFDKRCFTEPSKYDVPASNFVTFEIKDDSSPECSPPLNGFFRSGGQPSKSGVSQGICNGRTTEDNVTYSALSVLSNDSNQEDTTRDCDLDLDPSNLLNGHCSNNEIVDFGNRKSKGTLFSDSLLNSLTSEPLKENSMKIIYDSVPQINEDFSDLLSSISLPNHESKKNSKLHLSDFEVWDKQGVSAQFSNAISNHTDDIMKPNCFTTQSNSTLSDILSSISFNLHDSSQSGNNLSSHSNQILILNQLGPEVFKQKDSESNNGTLPDILSSISFDGINTSMQNGITSNSNLLLDDIKIPISNELNHNFSTLNFHTTDNASKLDASSLESNGNLSDMLSSIIFHESDNTAKSGLKSTSFFSSNSSQGFESDSWFNLKEPSSKLMKSDEFSTDKPTDGDILNFPSLGNDTSNNIKNCLLNKSLVEDKTFATSSISTPKTSNHTKSSMHDEENGEFSFFSVSPDNVFSAMLSNLSKTSDTQDKNPDENSTEISMLDLLKSVNTDSNGSLSEYLRTPSENKEIKTIKQASNTLDELLNIDLSTCIKTSDDSLNTLNNELPVDKVCADEKDNTVTKLGGFMKPVFDDLDLNCPKPPRMNLNQSLFAKSLSCKPKKNRILLQKAALIKLELYEHYFSHSISDGGESKVNKNIKSIKEDTNQDMVVCKTNDCMIRFKGRRLCPQEVQ